MRTVEVDVDAEMVDQFIKDFKFLVGGHERDKVLELRHAVMKVIALIWEVPDALNSETVRSELPRILAMKAALEQWGIFYDA